MANHYYNPNNNTGEPVVITPDMAKEFLERNKGNRRLYDAVIAKYARDMTHSAWYLSPNAIGFDENDRLIDGQHRLKACIMADIPFRSYIVYGLPPESQGIIDSNKKRSIADQMHIIYSVENSTLTTAVINALVALVISSAHISLTLDSTKDVYDLYKADIDLVLSQVKSVPGLVYSPVLACIVLSAKVDASKAIEFAEGYFNGNNLSIGSPILALRNFMINRKVGTKGAGGRGYRRYIMLYATTALLCYFTGKALKSQRINEKALPYFTTRQQVFIDLIKEFVTV